MQSLRLFMLFECLDQMIVKGSSETYQSIFTIHTPPPAPYF